MPNPNLPPIGYALPRAQLLALQAGGEAALADAMASFARSLLLQAGQENAWPAPNLLRLSSADVARLGNTGAGGLIAAALDLIRLLGHSAHGRKALLDLGFEPVLEQVEAE